MLIDTGYLYLVRVSWEVITNSQTFDATVKILLSLTGFQLVLTDTGYLVSVPWEIITSSQSFDATVKILRIINEPQCYHPLNSYSCS